MSWNWEEFFEHARQFLSNEPIISIPKIVNNIVPIGQMLTTLGIIVLFGALLIMGIKYMKAQPEERGKLKQQLIGVAIGGIVIFGAYSIWKICYDFFTEILE